MPTEAQLTTLYEILQKDLAAATEDEIKFRQKWYGAVVELALVKESILAFLRWKNERDDYTPAEWMEATERLAAAVAALSEAQD